MTLIKIMKFLPSSMNGALLQQQNFNVVKKNKIPIACRGKTKPYFSVKAV